MNALTVVPNTTRTVGSPSWSVITAAGRVVAIAYTETDAQEIASHLGAVRPSAPEAQGGGEAMPGIRNELAVIVRRDEGDLVSIDPNEAAAILRALAAQQGGAR